MVGKIKGPIREGYALRLWKCSVVKHYIEQRAVDHQAAVVMNKPQFPKPIHEKTNSRASGTDHLGEGLLADLGDHFGTSSLPK